MEPNHDLEGSDDPPSYPGEDTRLTSSKELSGWYSYGWAAEVFVICGIGSRVTRVNTAVMTDLGINRLIYPNHFGATCSRGRNTARRPEQALQRHVS